MRIHGNRKVIAAVVSVISNVTITAAKVLAAILSGSVSVLSEALHSVGDVIASLIAFFTVRISDKPADREHPYGHGKFETFTGLIEALLLMIAGLYVGYEAILRFIHPRAIEVDLAFMIIMVSAILNVFISTYIGKVAEETDSDALRADAMHLKADVITSAGVLFALFLVRWTNNLVFDPIIALILTLWILFSAGRIASRGFQLLVDVKLSDAEVAIIENLLRTHPGIHDFHQLRTRKSGSHRHVDAHILVGDNLSLIQAHELTEEVEDRIRAALPNVLISLHVEPYQRELQHRKKFHKDESKQ